MLSILLCRVIKHASKFLHSRNLAEVEALSTLTLDSKSQPLYGPSTDIWRSRVAQYSELLGESLVRQVRNVLDLNAELGRSVLNYNLDLSLSLLPSISYCQMIQGHGFTSRFLCCFSFAAVLMQHQPVWVMNVVPTANPEMLESIYNRGLLGIQHDW